MPETVEERLISAWNRTDQILEILSADSWLAKPIALRHPFIFYLGHLPAFAWNHVCGGVLERPPFNPAFDDMFSRGIDPDVDDPTRCHDHPDVPDRWPSMKEVVAYRDRVRGAVIESVSAVADRRSSRVMAREDRVFSMVIEHEMMHQETLLYMFQRLPSESKVRPDWLPPHVFGSARAGATVAVPGGTAALGAPFDSLAVRVGQRVPRDRGEGAGIHHRHLRRHQPAVPRLRGSGRLSHGGPLDGGGLRVAPPRAARPPGRVGEARRSMVLSGALRPHPTRGRGGLAGVRQPRRGESLRPVAGAAATDRRRVPPRGLRRPGPRGGALPMGRGAAPRGTRQLRLYPLVSYAERQPPGRRERVG